MTILNAEEFIAKLIKMRISMRSRTGQSTNLHTLSQKPILTQILSHMFPLIFVVEYGENLYILENGMVEINDQTIHYLIR